VHGPFESFRIHIKCLPNRLSLSNVVFLSFVTPITLKQNSSRYIAPFSGGFSERLTQRRARTPFQAPAVPFASQILVFPAVDELTHSPTQLSKMFQFVCTVINHFHYRKIRLENGHLLCEEDRKVIRNILCVHLLFTHPTYCLGHKV